MDLYLVDLPGYGYAKVARGGARGLGAAGRRSYLVGPGAAWPCASSWWTPATSRREGDETLRAFLDQHGMPYVVAANKIDKLGRGEIARRARDARPGRRPARAGGARRERRPTGTGIDELWSDDPWRRAVGRRRPPTRD